jgi:hypothetical protein
MAGGYLLTAPRATPGWEAITTDAAYAEAVKGYRTLSFSTLGGFEYREGMPLSALPADITSAQTAKVAIHGFMLPMDVSGDRVSHFLLNASYDMCQFDMTAGAPNQWVEVVMPAGRYAPYTHLPITVLGTFTLGEHRERGRVVSLYRLAADRVLTSE